MATRIVGFGHDGQNFGQVDLGGRFAEVQCASALNVGLARQDVLPRTLGKVLPGRRTPWAGIACSCRPASASR